MPMPITRTNEWPRCGGVDDARLEAPTLRRADDDVLVDAGERNRGGADAARALDRMSDAEFEDHAAEAKRSNHVFRRIDHHVGSLTCGRTTSRRVDLVHTGPDLPETFRPHWGDPRH